MINTLEQNNGPHPGFRRIHAKGVGVAGYFESNGRGVALSKASVFLPGRVPIIGRFSLAPGQPYLTDAHARAAWRFCSNCQRAKNGAPPCSTFPFLSSIRLKDFMISCWRAPYPATGEPDAARMQAFLAKHPESAKARQLIRSQPVSSGFENSTYNSLNAFRFINGKGAVAPVRWSMVPAQRFEPISTADPGQADKNYLFDVCSGNG
jgi:catalase